MKLKEISFQFIKNILYIKILLIHYNYLFSLLFYINFLIKDNYIIIIY
jgi:hypothetical protein